MPKELVWTLRRIARKPLPSVLMVAALAIGLASVTWVFTIVKAVLLEPLPYPEPDKVVRIWQDLALDTGARRVGLSLEHVRRLQSSSTTLEGLATFSTSEVSLTHAGETRSLAAVVVSPSLCRVLGVYPFMGRCFLPEEELSGGPSVAIVTWGLWREIFGEVKSLDGRSLRLSNGSHRIVGVLLPGFAFPEPETRVWFPKLFQPSRLVGYHEPTIARLKTGVTVEQATAEIEGLVPEGGILVRSVYEDMVAEVRPRLLLMLAAGLLVLAISCANVAAILISQMESRAADFWILIALGADSATLFRRTFFEGLIHCGAASGLGLLLSHFLLKWFVGQIPIRIPRLEAATVDGRVILLLFLCALLISILFGWLPLAVTRRSGGSLGAGSRRLMGGARARKLRWGILLGQSILLLALLNTVCLLARSFHLLISVDPGFEPSNLLSLQLQLRRDGLGSRESQVQILESLMERLKGLPGIEEVGVSGSLPLTPPRSMATLFVSGSESPEAPVVNVSVASEGFLRALGTPVLEGRLFEDIEADKRSTAVVSRSLARQYLGDDAVGKEIGFDPSGRRRRIVGVVEDVKYSGLNQDAPRMVYLPFPADLTATASLSSMYMVVRVSRDPHGAVETVRSAVESSGLDLRAEDLHLMEDRVWDSVADRGFWTVLLSGVALLGLTLTTIGLYGLTCLAVAMRTREIGIRMAIGATPFWVAGSILSEVFAIAAASTVPAWAATQFSSRLLAGLLYGVTASDSIAFLASLAILAIASVAGSMTAVRRAVSIDPALALRHEA